MTLFNYSTRFVTSIAQSKKVDLKYTFQILYFYRKLQRQAFPYLWANLWVDKFRIIIKKKKNPFYIQ